MTFDISVINERGILPDHVTNLINRTKLLRTTTQQRPMSNTSSVVSSSSSSTTHPPSQDSNNNPHSSPTHKSSSVPFRLPPALSLDDAAAAAQARLAVVADHGGLDLTRLDNFDSGRSIRTDDANVYEHEKQEQYAALAANAKEEEYWGYHDSYDPLLGIVSHTVTDMRPNCNVFYEQHWPNDDVVSGDLMDTIQYLASGFYRDTYQYSHYPYSSAAVDQTDSTSTRLEQVVIKRQRFTLPLSRQRQLKVRNEALAMEVLTSSPRTTRAYGHCAFSLMVEPAMQGIARTIVPYYNDFQNYPGVLPQQILNDHPELLSLNNLTALEKLDYALALTESMADIHGLPTGPLVLMDVSLDQWLVTADGRVVLNDFDNSIFLRWLVTEESYAPVWTAPVGMYQSPEEVAANGSGGTVPLLETTDVWKMGAVLYTILTGLQPYYNELHEERLDVMNDMIMAGTPPYVDPRYASHSFIEGRLVEIMMQCFRRDPHDRVDIFQVVHWLRETERLSLAESEP
jgi:Protein tyrosine and serine/threonine kinase